MIVPGLMFVRPKAEGGDSAISSVMSTDEQRPNNPAIEKICDELKQAITNKKMPKEHCLQLPNFIILMGYHTLRQ